MTATRKLSLHVEKKLIPRFFALLQQGFMVEVKLGFSIRSLLCGQFDLRPEYVEKRIQTILLDGRPVDDVDSVMVKESSTLALSAALPGLAGATLRKGGYYAPMRSQISNSKESVLEVGHDGVISLKLFNLLLKELGPYFIKRGIYIRGRDLLNFFKRQPDDFWAGCKCASVDGEELDPKDLAEIDWAEREVLLELRVV